MRNVGKGFILNALDYMNRFRGSGKQINLDALEYINRFERSGSHTASTRMLSTRCIVLEGREGLQLECSDYIYRVIVSGTSTEPGRPAKRLFADPRKPTTRERIQCLFV